MKPSHPALGIHACIALAALMLQGCQATDGSSRASSGTGSGGVSVADPRVAAEIEQKYVVGPNAARELDYSIDWQYLEGGSNLKHLTVQGDSVFALDGRNFLTRIKKDDGTRLWRAAVAEPIEEIVGVTFIENQVVVTTGGAMLVLDPGTGSQIKRQPLEKIANTPPIPYGDFLIYGSRNGQVVWHSSQIGYFWRGYLVSQSIQIQPVLLDDYLVAIGNDGVIMVLSASNATQYWSKKLLDDIVVKPAAGQGAVYVAGTDQYLWAFDIANGRSLWKVLTEYPLTQPPTLIGERVYQQVPRRGVVCFNAVPIDRPGGEKFWEARGVEGNVICQRGDQLLAWHGSSHRMTVLDAARGGKIGQHDLPKVDLLITAGENNTELYVADKQGQIVRLTPRK